MHAIPGLVFQRYRRRPGREPELPLGVIAADPDDGVAAHDRVHGIRLPREGLRVGARDRRAREVVEAAFAPRVAVDYPHCPYPSCFLARLPRQHVSPRPLTW